MDKWLENTNVVRAIALMIGILLWVIVHIDEQVGDYNPDSNLTRIETNVIYDVTVTPIGLDTQKYSLVSIEPQKVDITVRGRPFDLAKVSTEDGNSRVLVDLSNVVPGSNRLQLQALGFPEGVTVVSMNPSYVDVVVEEIAKKQVPVSVTVTGEPGNGFRAGEPVINPSQVYVTAPMSVLERIVEVRAEVNIEGAVESVSVEAKLEAVDAEGNVVEATLVPTTAHISVPITVPFKTLPLHIRLIGEPPAGYSVDSYTQSVSEVTVYGPEEVLDKLTVYDGLEINLSLLTSSKSYTFNIPLKDDIEQVYPSSVDVHIGIVKSETVTFEDVPIRLNGTNENFETVILEPEGGLVDITVEGAPDNLRDLSRNDLEVIVDVSNLPPGTHQRDLMVNLPIFLKVGENTPGTVIVEVREKPKDTALKPDPEPNPGTNKPEDPGDSSEYPEPDDETSGEPPDETDGEVPSTDNPGETNP